MRDSTESFDNVRLKKAVAEVEDRLRSQLEKGKKLRDLPITSEENLEDAQREMTKWEKFTRSVLELCIQGSMVEDFKQPPYGIVVSGRPLGSRARDFRDDMKFMIASLESIIDRLQLIPHETARIKELPDDEASFHGGKRVFIVHGHDNEMKQTVARVVEKLGLEALVLHEKPSGGLTLIEKLEKYANEADYAVILLSPDDEGREEAHSELQARPRQNVVFELGYFMGKLKRDRTCAIVKGNLEITSDISGVVYIQMDHGGGWKSELVAELKKAGFKVSADSLIGE